MRRTKKRRSTGRADLTRLAALLLPLLGGVAAGVGVALARRRRAAVPAAGPSVPGPARSAPAPLSDDPVTERVEHEWSCQCGQVYRIAGEGLHRIYWLPDASIADPVMDGRCANCGRALPGEQPDPVEAT
jgi:hypothetical protein